jgi:hypothetical protein
MKGIKVSRILILIILPAVVWLFTNSVVNRHVHVLSEGYIVTHAHPFAKQQTDSKDPNPHQHNKNELFLLNLFDTYIYSSISVLVLKSFLNACPQLLRFRVSHQVPVRKHFQVYHYHAPPFPG